MALLLRKIRKSRWYKTESMSWLSENELPADSLSDLGTKSNELSVYHISLNESNLDRVIAALAANSGFLSNFDYAIFNEEMLSNSGIKTKKTPGDSSDEQVNNWHIDLYELSAHKLLNLALQIKHHASIKRLSHKQVLNFIVDALISGHINRSNIKWESKEDQDMLDRLIAERS